MKKLIIFFIMSLWFLQACYEDKGNYTYAELNEVEVTIPLKSGYTIRSYWGEEVVVEPTLKFANPKDTLEFDYVWRCDLDTISHERILKYTPTGACKNYTLQLYVIDRKTQFTYYGTVSLAVNTPYKYGFALLAEKSDGSSAIHYLRLETADAPNYYYTPFYDVYVKEQPGDPLGKKPYYMAENLSTTANGGDELTVLQEDGRNVSLAGTDFAKVVYLDEEFSGGVYPDGMKPKEVYFSGGNNVDVVLGDNGKVYTRVNPNTTQSGGFHQTYFLPLPQYFDKGNTYVDRLIPGHPYSRLVMMYDKENHRLVGVAADGTSSVNGAPVVINDKSSNPDDFVNLNDLGDYELIWIADWGKVYGTGKYASILKKDGVYYYQAFNLTKQNNQTAVDVSNQSKSLFAGNGVVSDNTKYAMMYTGNYMYFAEGKSLYYCEFRNEGGVIRQIVKHVHDFDKNIVCLEGDYNGGRLLIALEGGKLYLFDTSDQVLGSPDPWSAGKMYESPDDANLGEIKRIIFKWGDTNNRNNAGDSTPF